MAQETMYTRLFWIMVIVLAGWTGGIIVFAFTMRSDVNIMRVQLDALSVKFEEMKLDTRQRTELRYTSVDASKDKAEAAQWNRDQDAAITVLKVWQAQVQQRIADGKMP